MRRAHLACAAVAFSTLVGCSGREHAPFIPLTPTAGGSGSGGSPALDAGASGGSDTEGLGGFGADGADSGAGGAPVNAPPWAITGPLDQTDIYFMGLLNRNACDNQVLARIADPTKYTLGFDCAAPPNRNIIVGGKLYYEFITGVALYEFVPDLVEPYPPDPFANDKKLNAPCPIITGFMASPKGEILYHCIMQGWHTLGGTTIYSGDDDFVAVTNHRLAATPGTSGSGVGAGVMSLEDGVLHAVPALTNNLIGFRVHGEIFHYVVAGEPGQLWSVDAAGNTTKLGEYALSPAKVRPGSSGSLTLAPDDSLYMTATDVVDKTIAYIYRVRIDGTAEIVYSTADPHTVMMTGRFVTGP